MQALYLYLSRVLRDTSNCRQIVSAAAYFVFQINVANTSIELSKYNIYRIGRILYPPRPEILSNMCRQGFDDALRFLHMNNLINCTRCLAVQSTFVVMDNATDDLDYDPECHECNRHRQVSLWSSSCKKEQII